MSSAVRCCLFLIVPQLLSLCALPHIPLATEYPGHIGGRCVGSFDCDPNGPRVCVTLLAVRDCFADCPNAADEECPVNEVLCDAKARNGCGKCVKMEERDMYCSDRRYPCTFQLAGCNQTGIGATISSPFDATTPIGRPVDGCLGTEFQCITSHECISIVDILDGIEQCNDGSDERYCKEMAASDMCQEPKQCSFNPIADMFTCDCPLGYSRTSLGLCIPFLAPAFSSDCADLQRRYHFTIASGMFTLHDWNCAKPEMCPFIARCEMNLFGGGWTIIMQRFNTSLSFDKGMLEYENGFDLDESNFWIGLKRMHHLTSRPQCPNELLLRLRTAIDGQIILVRYSHFIVYEKLLDYRLNIGSIVYGNGMNTANELAESQLCPFVTSSERRCIGGGGWWKKGCQQKGVLTATNRAHETYPGLTWNGKRLSALQMLIRPRGYVPLPTREIPPKTSNNVSTTWMTSAACMDAILWGGNQSVLGAVQVMVTQRSRFETRTVVSSSVAGDAMRGEGQS
ncbi:unnamed protein product [Litomosoides sigmodontis]|uniref:Fibrinogen C-terminal domain-containing protein n=1 Tax=Litomosoides sigmodontis TaxID=42156 RepID=A0A3P6SKG7_LITSI|nr:unnamed protein product [Litomosoides sigmodontis]